MVELTQTRQENQDDASGTGALYSVTQIRAIEAAALPVLPDDTLMQRAGAAATAFAAALLQRLPGLATFDGVPVLVIAGPGNNGGDAFECAAGLARLGCAVTILSAPRDACGIADTDRARAQQRARVTGEALRLAPATGDVAGQRPGCLNFADIAIVDSLCNQSWALVVDGLFGIGLTRAPDGVWPSVIAAVNRIAALRLALDVPSGLNADTGMVLLPATPNATESANPRGSCINATHTLAFIGDKPGLHTGDGCDMAGQVTSASLDIAASLYPLPHARLSRPAAFDAPRHRRRQNSHKGSNGDVQVIGGAAGMTGAAILAALAALKTGSGRVLIGFVDAAQAPSTITGHPELMCRLAAELDFSRATVVIGPGLGQSAAAHALVARACSTDAALVLDADGLNLVAASPALQQQLAARGAGLATLLTPHPLEAARLLGTTAAAIQADRLEAATLLAQRFTATVILKGAGTVIAHAGNLSINPTGNPALASGGTGDVLAGICGALLAQGWPAHQAALAAVWIHGAAADALVAAGIGPVGVTASEIIDAARTVLNALIGPGSSSAAWQS
ncbi:MAG: NAD(P)H-hydrate dehydratase [Herminiimonas sp.]|nr:NAD(P)H-hydrate dehydratase [Herminiimonas sp.]